MTDCPRRNMQCKQRWNKANHASNCRVATIIENSLPPHQHFSLPLHQRVTIINHLGVAAVAWRLTSEAASGHESGTLAGATGQTHTKQAHTAHTHIAHHTHPTVYKTMSAQGRANSFYSRKLKTDLTFYLISNGFCSEDFGYVIGRGFLVFWKLY